MPGSSAFAVTFEPGTCWRPDESVVSYVIADPEQTLTACGVAGNHHDQTVPNRQIGAIGRMGAVHRVDHSDETLPRLENALTYLRELADRHSEASTARKLGTVHRLQRCYEKATRCFQQVLDALDQFEEPLRSGARASSGAGRGIRLAALQGSRHAGW